jgi:hypothetical protein
MESRADRINDFFNGIDPSQAPTAQRGQSRQFRLCGITNTEAEPDWDHNARVIVSVSLRKSHSSYLYKL